MHLERRTVVHPGLRKFSSQGENFTWYIILRVGRSEQNAWNNRNALRPCRDIGADRFIDGWAGEL
jgi:hypothetical protein